MGIHFSVRVTTHATTDVMVGPHGAGLMHNIFMPDRGTLIELHVDNSGQFLLEVRIFTVYFSLSVPNSGANQHFHNLARWQGRKYISRTMSNPIDINELVRVVSRAVEDIDITSM
jgi:hypothetical protein